MELYEYKFDGIIYDKINYLHISDFWYRIYYITGNIFWILSEASDYETSIEKRELTNPNVEISKIDITYLGTNSIPNDLLVDGEFLLTIILIFPIINKVIQ